MKVTLSVVGMTASAESPPLSLIWQMRDLATAVAMLVVVAAAAVVVVVVVVVYDAAAAPPVS